MAKESNKKKKKSGGAWWLIFVVIALLSQASEDIDFSGLASLCLGRILRRGGYSLLCDL